jgi:hexulose-6-phosphate isomerase
MKKGISIWSFDASLSLEQCFKLAKQAGFDGVEVALAESGEINMNSDADDMKKIAGLAKENGIELYSLATGLYWQYSLTSNKKEIREKAQSVLHKQIEIASWLGCKTILVIPGVVNADFISGCETVEYDIAYERALDAIRQAVSFAEEMKVEIGLENVWNKFLLSPLEMRDFIDNFSSQYVGSYFDVGNVLYSGYPEHWVKILNKRIKKVHLKDYKRVAGGLHGFVDLLGGDVDFPAVIHLLKEINYDGWLTAEMLPPYTHYPDQILVNTSLSMDRIINMK